MESKGDGIDIAHPEKESRDKDGDQRENFNCTALLLLNLLPGQKFPDNQKSEAAAVCEQCGIPPGGDKDCMGPRKEIAGRCE